MAPAVGKLSVVLIQLHGGVPGRCHDDVGASKDLTGSLVVSAALHNQSVDVLQGCEAAVGLQIHPQWGALKGRVPAFVCAVQVPADILADSNVSLILLCRHSMIEHVYVSFSRC